MAGSYFISDFKRLPLITTSEAAKDYRKFKVYRIFLFNVNFNLSDSFLSISEKKLRLSYGFRSNHIGFLTVIIPIANLLVLLDVSNIRHRSADFRCSPYLYMHRGSWLSKGDLNDIIHRV